MQKKSLQKRFVQLSNLFFECETHLHEYYTLSIIFSFHKDFILKKTFMCLRTKLNQHINKFIQAYSTILQFNLINVSILDVNILFKFNIIIIN